MADAVSTTLIKGEELEQTTFSVPATLPVVPERVPLPEVLRQIHRDATDDPQKYLSETLVPRGGE